MSCVSEKTNSSNMDDMTKDAESECKFFNYYKTIITKSNKTTNTFIRRAAKLNSYKRCSSIIKRNGFTKKVNSISNSTDKIKEKKSNQSNKLILNPKHYKLNFLFNNLLIREKQKTFRKNTVKVRSYDIRKDEPSKLNYVVNSNYSLLSSFLKQTKSNFNNKYKVVYSISDWRKKKKIKTLLNTIKSYQHKSNFTDYLTNKLYRKINPTKKIAKMDVNKNDESSKIPLYNTSGDYFKNIFHQNYLIKIKTMNDIKFKPNQLRKSKTEIFDKNNTFFKTMPMKKLKQ